MFQSILKIKMVTVQVNGNEMAWVCENHFGTEPNVQMAYSIGTFAWDEDGNLLIKPTIRCPRASAPTATPTSTFSRVSRSPRRLARFESEHRNLPTDGRRLGAVIGIPGVDLLGQPVEPLYSSGSVTSPAVKLSSPNSHSGYAFRL